jgi:hypothetical protein
MTTCESCGADNGDEDVFCSDCGAKLGGSGDTTATAALPPLTRPTRLGNDHVAPPPVMSVGSDGVDELGDAALLGSGEPNATYLGQRLGWDDKLEGFDISAALARALASSSTRGLAIFFAIIPGVPVGFVFDKLFGSALLVLYLVVLAMCCAFIWAAPFFRRHYFPFNEWKLSLDGKGEHAGQVFEHICHAVIKRQSPIQYRVITLPDGVLYLNLRLDRYDAYITTMAFGRDLYIGWSLWASGAWSDLRAGRRGFFKTLFGLPYWLWIDLQASRSGASFDVAMLHQFDVVKALRECVHAVTREGVQAAVGTVPFAGQGTIGSQIPSGTSPGFGGSAMSFPAPKTT